MIMQISPNSIALPILLDLLERDYTWEVLSTANLLDLYGYVPEIYEWENGGQALVDKVVVTLSPFMQYVHEHLVGYMLTYTLSAEEGVHEYKNTPQWAYNRYPREKYRGFKVIHIHYSNDLSAYDELLGIEIENAGYFTFAHVDGKMSNNFKER